MDDGAETLEESVALVKMAAAAGTTDLVGTPHASPEYRFDPQVVEDRLRQVEAATGGILRLYSGCDFHLSYENIEDALKNPRKYTINGKTFLLVEFADRHIPQTTADIFDRFMDRDIFPIVTHPERNPILSHKLDQLAALVERGSFVQVTAKSLEGGFGNGPHDAGWKMLQRGIVHFVASDGHDPEYRPTRMDAAFNLVAKKMGRESAELLFVSNPTAVIRGEGPSSIVAAGAKKKGSFWKRWKKG